MTQDGAEARTCDRTTATGDHTCHLCGDEAIAGRVIAVDVSAGTATVSFDSGPATVALDLVDAAVGDTLLVHLGFAIARLEER